MTLPMTLPGVLADNPRLDRWLNFATPGKVELATGRVELGQGVLTAMSQIAAEELDVAFERITVRSGDTDRTPNEGYTAGSQSMQGGSVALRAACAEARALFLEAAAQRLGCAAAELLVRDGRILHNGAATQFDYWSLAPAVSLAREATGSASPKAAADYAVVGRSAARIDLPAKLFGEAAFVHDMAIDGMVHARVIRPAAIKASLERWNDFDCKRIPGYAGVVRKGNFLAVVAKNEWAAIKAAKTIEASWSKWEGLPEKSKLWDHVRATKIAKDEVFQNVGDAAKALGGAPKTLKATYDFAVHTHGSIGPSCAVAEFADGKLTVWTASQATHLLRKQLARMLDLAELNVRCIYVEGAGCYGRNGHEDAAADAALIARETGVPVRVQWSRADEHGWDPKGPPTLLDYRAAVDASGNIVAWESEAYIPDRPGQIAVTLVAADLANMPKEGAHPGNIQQALAIPYAIPNIKATAHWLAETPFRPSWIRTPGRMQNTYGNECFLDELAAAAGVDPFEFRVRNLKDPRGLELLERLKKLASWTPRAQRAGESGDVAKGRGVSYIKYELVRTYVGVVADVEVNRQTGKIRVERFYVAHDCGQIINPDGLRNQLEGNIVQTVSRTLIEDLQWNRSAVTSLDWETYPILRFPDVPEVVIELIDRPQERPWGAGEPTAAVVPSAIANAVYDAIGVRLRSVPFTTEKVLAAMKTA